METSYANALKHQVSVNDTHLDYKSISQNLKMLLLYPHRLCNSLSSLFALLNHEAWRQQKLQVCCLILWRISLLHTSLFAFTSQEHISPELFHGITTYILQNQCCLMPFSSWARDFRCITNWAAPQYPLIQWEKKWRIVSPPLSSWEQHYIVLILLHYRATHAR